MDKKEDFFSPEKVDERLDLSLLLRETSMSDQTGAKADPNLLLVHDLRYLYGAEGTENVRSLRRVWEHLAEQHMSAQGEVPRISLEPGQHLRLLKSGEAPASKIVRRGRRLSVRSLAALAALLFLVIMVGSLWTIIHLLPPAPNGAGSITLGTPAVQPTQPQPTPIPGYPYPAPGANAVNVLSSLDNFYTLAWSADSKRLAASTQDKVLVWNSATRRSSPIAGPPASGGSLRALAWSPDGRSLAMGTNPVEVIDPGSGKLSGIPYPVHVFWPVVGNDTQAAITALAWSPDGSLLAVGALRPNNGCVVQVWIVHTHKLSNSFDCPASPGGPTSLSWSSDGRYLATASGQVVLAWDTTIRKATIIFQQNITARTNVTWSPIGPLLAFVNNEATQVWDVSTNRLVSGIAGTPNGVLTWAPDGRYLASASGSKVVLLDASSGAHLYTYTGNVHYVFSLAWSPDGRSLASGEGGTPGYNFVRVWSA
jgi:WD40 repeat protein